MAYSRISLNDIQRLLLLENTKDAEYVILKCIKDGVIDAFVDHQGGYMQSREILDVYSTSEPTGVFEKRIKFCCAARTESLKAMKYPGEASQTKKPLEDFSSSAATAAVGEENNFSGEDDEMGF